jgi:hypothetical protein
VIQVRSLRTRRIRPQETRIPSLCRSASGYQ